MRRFGNLSAAEYRGAATAGAIAFVLVLANYLLSGDFNLDLTDEGFIWYGVERTIVGEVPLRDFQSYEPGRYYWAASWSHVFGDGILALRQSTAVFQALGLFCGLLIGRRLVSHPAALFGIGIVLLVWMFPRHKLFEPSIAMMAVYVALRLLESRNQFWHLAAGIFVGLAAFFGRNHALYSGLGILFLAIGLCLKRNEGTPFSRIVALATGGALGALPLLGMMLYVDGFAASFWESILFFIEQGANLSAPIPWPWRVSYADMPWPRAAAQFSIGIVFLLVPLIYGTGVALALFGKRETLPQRHVLLAATAIGIFYFHHASIRSDAAHLAQSIHPMLLASLAIPGALGWSGKNPATWAAFGAIALITISVIPSHNPMVVSLGQTKSLVTQRIAGEDLHLSPGSARWISRIERVVANHVGDEDQLFIAPFFPGLYPVLGRSSPTWGIYLLWEANDRRQDEMLSSLERVEWALIWTGGMNGEEDLRFQNTHRRVWEYLTRHFESLRDPMLPRGFVLLHRRTDDPERIADELAQCEHSRSSLPAPGVERLPIEDAFHVVGESSTRDLRENPREGYAWSLPSRLPFSGSRVASPTPSH